MFSYERNNRRYSFMKTLSPRQYGLQTDVTRCPEGIRLDRVFGTITFVTLHDRPMWCLPGRTSLELALQRKPPGVRLRETRWFLRAWVAALLRPLWTRSLPYHLDHNSTDPSFLPANCPIPRKNRSPALPQCLLAAQPFSFSIHVPVLCVGTVVSSWSWLPMGCVALFSCVTPTAHHGRVLPSAS